MTKTVETILGDIYDAWRAQDLEWLATYLPDDFHHVMHIPAALFPVGGRCEGKLQVSRQAGRDRRSSASPKQKGVRSRGEDALWTKPSD
jgi:hypothetical protein